MQSPNIVDVACDPVEICANTNPTDPSFDACFQENIAGLACGLAIGESTTFNTCLDDLCGQGNADGGTPTLPASCKNPIVYPM
jgi:hypothetical protein